MRQLVPHLADDVDPAAAHAAARRPAPGGRPWVAINMVASIDGATAVDGVSGGLGSAADKAVFRAIRAVADVILVAAGTVRAEGYGPPRVAPDLQAARRARGQSAQPRIAIVSRRLDLDPALGVFGDPANRPLVLTTTDAPADGAARLGAVADVEEVGSGSVDLAAALGRLHDLGAPVVVCEGGPSLNGQLIAAGLVDEIDVTWSPLLVGGSSDRIAVGTAAGAVGLELAHLWQEGPVLLARYVRSGAS